MATRRLCLQELQNVLQCSRAAWHLSIGCSALRRDPYVTGTSVLGIVYKDGVMLAADTLGEGVWREPNPDSNTFTVG